MKILAIDDDQDFIDILKNYLSTTEHELSTKNSGFDIIDDVKNKKYDLILLDIKMPDKDGLKVLTELKKYDPSINVVMLTGINNVETVVESMTLGAIDFLIKPINEKYLIDKLENYSKITSLLQENIYLKSQLRDKYGFENIIGEHPLMTKIFETVKKISSLESTVLITGESGTGKEMIARSIHFNGNRSTAPFIPIDCTVLNANLIESELFGHEKGAFTGASVKKTGLIKSGDGGTVFFDEIGELPLEMQSKLLRVLQEREIRPVGSNHSLPINVRVVAATNKDLGEEVEKGKFRLDLFYRLNIINIKIPPLRKRASDIPLLIDYFISELQKAGKTRVLGIEKEAIAKLKEYSWQGNIRELENCIERSCALSENEYLSVSDLGENSFDPSARDVNNPLVLRTLESYEKEAIMNTLSLTAGDKNEAAKILSIGKSTLYNKLKQYNLN